MCVHLYVGLRKVKAYVRYTYHQMKSQAGILQVDISGCIVKTMSSKDAM